MDDNTDIPLEVLADAGCYVGQVIDLASVRIQVGRTKIGPGIKPCEHKSLIYSQTERRVWCEDCSRTVDNFDAFLTFTKHFEAMLRDARSKMLTAEEAMKTSARRRATKEIDRAWSGHTMAICCPHCHGGLLPEDFARGASMCSREIEIARRAKPKSP